MLEWHVVTAATYYGASDGTLNDEYLYFLSDTGEIMKGAKPFNQAVEMLTGPDYALPTQPARKRIYIHPTTLEGKIYDGSAWVTVIKPIQSTVVADDENPVNSKAVIAYVAKEIEKVTGSGELVANVAYDKSAIKLTVTNADKSSKDLVLEGIATSLNYDSKTGALTIKDISGNVLGSAVNLDLERFVQSARYDTESKKIILTFNDATTPLEIDVGDLVDTYTAEDSTSIHLTVTNNKFKAEAIVAATDGNMLQSTDSGLFVAATDLSNYQTLVASATAGHVATLNAQGQVQDGGVSVGGAALAADTSATVLATEAAVKAAVDALNTSLTEMIQGKMALVSGATDGDILTVNAAGQAVDSGKKVGGATLAENADANTLATEVAVKTAVSAVEAAKLDKTDVVAPSASATTGQAADAKAVYDQLTWKTTL